MHSSVVFAVFALVAMTTLVTGSFEPAQASAFEHFDGELKINDGQKEGQISTDKFSSHMTFDERTYQNQINKLFVFEFVM